MPRGKVKWFSPEKGYGFIRGSEDEDVFVHYRDILGNGFRTLNQGEEVEYQLCGSRRGLRAREVIRLKQDRGRTLVKVPEAPDGRDNE